MSLRLSPYSRLAIFGGGDVSWSSYWKSHSDFWYKENTRSGLTLPNSITPGVNDASLLLPLCSVVRTSGVSGYYLDSGIIPGAATIVVFKGRINTLPGTNTYGAMGEFDDAQGYFALGASGYTGKWYFGWGNNDASGAENADTNMHLFIAYNKKLWVVDPSTGMDDASILNVINTVTPKVTVTATFTGTPSRSLMLGRINYGSNILGSFDYSECYIGTISGTITWAKKYIFNNTIYAYDLISASGSGTWAAIASPTIVPAKIYSAYGSTYCLDNGHTLLRNNATLKYQSVPKISGGTYNHTVANPSGFETIGDFAGDTLNVNYTDCLIQHSLAFWDRSNATIWSALARGASTYYDSTSATTKKQWHISEHDFNKFQAWANTGYEGKAFIKTGSNSMDYYAWTKIKEIIVMTANQSASKINQALTYCSDASTWNYPYWNKSTFATADIQKTLNQFAIATGQTRDVTSLDTTYTGTEQFCGSVLTPKGMIYCMPFMYNGILKINTNTDALSIIGAGGFAGGTNRWSCAAMGMNGYIYGFPLNAATFLKIDPTIDSYAVFGTNAVPSAYYSCLSVGKYIYVAPFEATQFIKLNTDDDSMAAIGPTYTTTPPDGLFSGMVYAPNGYIYCLPNRYNKVVKINPSDDSFTEFGSGLDRAIFKFWSGVCTPSGIIYMAPYNDTRIMKIDTNTDTISYIDTTAPYNGENFATTVLGVNGKVYMIPCEYRYMIELDPSNDSIVYFGDELVTRPQYKYGTALLAQNGQIYCWGSTRTAKVLSAYTLDKNMALSRLVNKY